MKAITLQKYLNNMFGVMTVLSLDYEIKNRTFFKCKCNRCSNLNSVRSDHLLKNPKSCSFCTNNLQKEIADKKYLKDRKFRNRLNSIKNNAKSRNFKFNLNEDYISVLLNSNCYYCNIPNANGIDRINSSIGYIKSNTVSCCSICNIMKNKFDKQVFLNKIESIYHNLIDKGSTTISKESTL